MKQADFFKNKLNLALFCSWAGLYLLQMILSFAGVRGGVISCLLAVLYAGVVGTMAFAGWWKKERILQTISITCAAIQVVMLLLSIPFMITGADILPKFLQCLLHVPGYSLLAAPLAWRWVFAAFWGVILWSTIESSGRTLAEYIASWWRSLW